MFKNAVRHFSYVEKEQKRGEEGKEKREAKVSASRSSKWLRTGLAEKVASL